MGIGSETGALLYSEDHIRRHSSPRKCTAASAVLLRSALVRSEPPGRASHGREKEWRGQTKKARATHSARASFRSGEIGNPSHVNAFVQVNIQHYFGHFDEQTVKNMYSMVTRRTGNKQEETDMERDALEEEPVKGG